ncbi:MAG: rod shape-determining protein MreD [Planctomycetota bacterium]
MKNIFIILITFIIIILEILFSYRLEIKGIRPDFLFILVFLISFKRPLDKSIFPVWFIGLLKDLISQSGLGTTALLYLISAILISLVKQIIFKEDMEIQMAVLFFSGWFCHFCNGLGILLFYGTLPLGYIVLKSAFISLYTLVIGGIFLIVLYRIQWYMQWKATQVP